MMQKSDHITGINHVILLFDILDELSRCTMYKLLFITAYSIYNNGNVQVRGPVDRVYDYVYDYLCNETFSLNYLYNYFKEKVSLHVLAHHVNLIQRLCADILNNIRIKQFLSVWPKSVLNTRVIY